MPVTDDELRVLLRSAESDRIERKQSASGDVLHKIREAICGFANDLPHHQLPGYIFVGVNDDGTPSGLAITDKVLLDLATIKLDGKILPPPTMSVEKRSLDGNTFALIEVTPSDAPPVRLDGRVLVRIGSRRGIATAQDERVLNEKRRFRDRAFDTHPITGSSLDDLDRAKFENEYLPRAIARDVLEQNHRTYEEKLASTGMIASIDLPTPTVVGLLTLGKSPRTWLANAYVQFLRIDGESLTDPLIDQDEIDGPVDQLLRRLDEKIRSHNRESVVFANGEPTDIRSPDYPFVALQQLVRNAVMHRTYENTNAPVKVYWFNDRIEIHSPGGPFGVVTRETFGRPGYNDYRNPKLAEVLKTLGFVQRFGAGIELARRTLEENGNEPPAFIVETNVVMVCLTPRRHS